MSREPQSRLTARSRSYLQRWLRIDRWPPVGGSAVTSVPATAVRAADTPATATAPTAAPPRAGSAASTGDPVARGVGAFLALLALGMLGFLGYVTGVSDLQQNRAQAVAYTEFRNNTYLATQPVQYVVPGTTAGAGTEPADVVPSLAVGTPVALLQIPELRLSQVVLEGTDAATLMDGPGHRRNTVLPGQPGASYVYGRRASFGGPFADVARLPVGTPITVTTGQGTAVYRVTGVRRPGDPLPAALAAGAGRLTLQTAGGRPYLPTSAVFVDAALELATMPNGSAFAVGLRPSAVQTREQAFATDQSAFLPLALWAQLLVVCLAAVSFAWVRWGRPSTWLVAAPVVLAVAWQVAETAARLLPNLL